MASATKLIDAKDPSRQHIFDAVIMDEACQASEPQSCIPLRLKPPVTVLVGDPRQLPPFVQSKSAELGRSMFERMLGSLEEKSVMLEQQYRMAPEIVAWPSKQFYGGQLANDASVQGRSGGYTLVNVANGVMTKAGSSFMNREEVAEVKKWLVAAQAKPDFRSKSVGVVSYYKAQVNALTDELRSLGADNIEVSTVDGFQGREKDVILLSCVRAGGVSVGFLDDEKRLNVALTRAKSQLVVFGCFKVLEKDKVYRELLLDGARRGVLRGDPWQPTSEGERRKKNKGACYDWMNNYGSCSRGDKCKFWHDPKYGGGGQSREGGKSQSGGGAKASSKMQASAAVTPAAPQRGVTADNFARPPSPLVQRRSVSDGQRPQPPMNGGQHLRLPEQFGNGRQQHAPPPQFGIMQQQPNYNGPGGNGQVQQPSYGHYGNQPQQQQNFGQYGQQQQQQQHAPRLQQRTQTARARTGFAAAFGAAGTLGGRGR